MPVFDVTINRTGCVMVEADTPEEALFIAQNCDENEVAWTDEWGADSAEQIATSLAEMEDDAALVVSDPYAKACILAKRHGFFCCPATDGRLCLAPICPSNVELSRLKSGLEKLGYKTEVLPATGGSDTKVEHNGKLYTTEEISKISGAPEVLFMSYAYNKFLLVGLPGTTIWRVEE